MHGILRPLRLATALVLSLCQPALAEGDAARGADVFARCAACHQVGPTAQNGVGPHLNALLSRQIAAVPGFGYSDGLTALSGQAWTRDLVSAYIADPTSFVGERSSMPAQRLRDQQIADLLAYLATQ